MSSAESTPLEVGRGLVDYTHWIYGLHSLAVLLALGSSAHAIALKFAFSLPSIVAVVMSLPASETKLGKPITGAVACWRARRPRFRRPRSHRCPPWRRPPRWPAST